MKLLLITDTHGALDLDKITCRGSDNEKRHTQPTGDTVDNAEQCGFVGFNLL